MTPADSPSAVAERLFQRVADRRWDDVPDLVDPAALIETHAREVASARSRLKHRQPRTVEDYLAGQPDLPRAVAEYYVERSEIHVSDDELKDYFGVSTVEELERLSPEELMRTVLHARDDHARMRNFLAAEHPEISDQEFALPPDRRSVIGEIVRDNLAYVLYTAPHGHGVLYLRRSNGEWRALPAGELFHDLDATSMFAEGSGDGAKTLAVEQAPWISRRFDHVLDASLFPSVLERFRSTPARLQEFGAIVSILKAHPNGKWSMQEHLGHLIDLNELGERRLENFIDRADTLVAADMTNRKTEEAHYNERVWWELLETFRTAREAQVTRLEALSADVIAHKALHPRLNRTMNVVEWLFFVCEHDDHHLARMRAQSIELSHELFASLNA